jgi:hypothetical protein
MDLVNELLVVSDSQSSLARSDYFIWTPKLLEAVIQLCEKRRYYGLARRLLKDLHNDGDGNQAKIAVKIPKRVYHSLINIVKSDNAMEEGADVLKMCLEVRNG